MNIGEDLSHYSRFLAAQPDPDSLLRSSVLSSLRELMEVTASLAQHHCWLIPAVGAEPQGHRSQLEPVAPEMIRPVNFSFLLLYVYAAIALRRHFLCFTYLEEKRCLMFYVFYALQSKI